MPEIDRRVVCDCDASDFFFSGNTYRNCEELIGS